MNKSENTVENAHTWRLGFNEIFWWLLDPKYHTISNVFYWFLLVCSVLCYNPKWNFL